MEAAEAVLRDPEPLIPPATLREPALGVPRGRQADALSQGRSTAPLRRRRPSTPPCDHQVVDDDAPQTTPAAPSTPKTPPVPRTLARPPSAEAERLGMCPRLPLFPGSGACGDAWVNGGSSQQEHQRRQWCAADVGDDQDSARRNAAADAGGNSRSSSGRRRRCSVNAPAQAELGDADEPSSASNAIPDEGRLRGLALESLPDPVEEAPMRRIWTPKEARKPPGDVQTAMAAATVPAAAIYTPATDRQAPSAPVAKAGPSRPSQSSPMTPVGDLTRSVHSAARSWGYPRGAGSNLPGRILATPPGRTSLESTRNQPGILSPGTRRSAATMLQDYLAPRSAALMRARSPVQPQTPFAVVTSGSRAAISPGRPQSATTRCTGQLAHRAVVTNGRVPSPPPRPGAGSPGRTSPCGAPSIPAVAAPALQAALAAAVAAQPVPSSQQVRAPLRRGSERPNVSSLSLARSTESLAGTPATAPVALGGSLGRGRDQWSVSGASSVSVEAMPPFLREGSVDTFRGSSARVAAPVFTPAMSRAPSLPARAPLGVVAGEQHSPGMPPGLMAGSVAVAVAGPGMLGAQFRSRSPRAAFRQPSLGDLSMCPASAAQRTRSPPAPPMLQPRMPSGDSSRGLLAEGRGQVLVRAASANGRRSRQFLYSGQAFGLGTSLPTAAVTARHQAMTGTGSPATSQAPKSLGAAMAAPQRSTAPAQSLSQQASSHMAPMATPPAPLVPAAAVLQAQHTGQLRHMTRAL
mmetsp:Transcript_17574/g.30769  ORF Transcript_17574/g.30769 Transcript_17574/m.30769 type:complete len:748 (+) Transcript_17574:37-2280(+)